MAAEFYPKSTWRKKPSQKGKLKFKLLNPRKVRTPKPPPPPLLSARKKASVRKARKKKAEAGRDGAVENPVRRRLDLEEEEADGDDSVGRNPLLVRRRLDLDVDDAEVGSGTSIGCFNRAMLMDNLRSLAKLAFALGDDDDVKTKTKTKTKAPRRLASPKIDLRPYSRAQLMENLRNLAKHVDTSTADGQQQGATKKKKKAMPPTRRVNKLVLKIYKSKKQRAATDHEDEDDDPIAMALAVRNESAGTELLYVPHWVSQSVATPDAKTLRQLVPITPAIEAAYDDLVRSDETCLGDDLDSVPEGPELEEERQRLQVLVDKFMGPVRAIIGKREFCNWKGSVLTNVVGTFLTQNVTDVHSSNAFMNIAAKFSFAKNESNVAQSTHVTLITDGRDLGVSKQCDKDINELLTSLRTGEISNSELDKERIKKVLLKRFKIPTTVEKISKDIESFLEKDTSPWKYVLEEAYKNGYRKEETSETIDWEALLHTSFGEIEECLKERGTQSQMTFRILLLLIRIKRDHGNIDLEWLRYIPRAKAKEYLQSIIGIGYKSDACIRLLALRHRGFPVDVNVARLVTRLGWVPLEPLGDSIEFHMVEKNPVMARIQKRLEPLFCKIPPHKVYELHCQLITFGKSICSQNRPNCGACPFTKDCKYYKSLFEGGMHTLLKDHRWDKSGQTNMDERIHGVVIVKPSREHMYQCQIEMGKSIERHSTEPIIEMPPTPAHEYPESSSEEGYEQEYQEVYEQEYQQEYEQEYHNIVDIEDDIPYLDLRRIKPVENATSELSYGTDMVLIHPRDSPIPIQRRYRLRTEYLAYIIPDGHEILDKFEPRVHGDCNPYLFIIRDYNDHIVNATILIPCRTANREIFPLDGTYFQINEVFADHSSTCSPIQIKRDIFWNFGMCRVYFGTSLSTITKGQTQEGIQRLYHSGYICCREFDRSSRRATILSAAFHNELQKKTGKKRHIPDSSPNSVEGNDKDRAQYS
ncbi:hypothetical protein SORBI_3001G188500 [Sorghum bicolor]|uniref:Demeter RRM-fold domain-containing protein n=1 Tax=Sorghum bicolor TaxID=4558 RepID=A0A1Z5S6X4_SORBI|nr:hypothetical protein SORBI_3001G188500 [Sorghum bicolor]